MQQRAVTTEEFDDRLDQILGVERGPNGEPSAHDFRSVVIADLIETIPPLWDSLPTDTANGLRMLVAVAPLLGYPYVVWCRERDAETIELVDLDIDLGFSFSSETDEG